VEKSPLKTTTTASKQPAQREREREREHTHTQNFVSFNKLFNNKPKKKKKTFK
jgi:hypothetical protein